MLTDVMGSLVHEAKTTGRGKGEAGYIKHYGVFTQVVDSAKTKTKDTWTPVQKCFGPVSAQDVANAVIALAGAGKNANIRIGDKHLLILSAEDFAKLGQVLAGK